MKPDKIILMRPTYDAKVKNPGSRGGHIIGYRNGEPIYGSSKPSGHGHLVGSTWPSKEGKREVKQVVSTSGGTRLAIGTEGSPHHELWEPEHFHRNVESDKGWHKWSVESEKKRQEGIKKEAEEKHYREHLNGFTDGMTAMKRGRVASTLSKNVSSGGRVLTTRKLIEEKVAGGSTIRTLDLGKGKTARLLQAADGSYVDEGQITKTGMDYAEFLIGKSSTSKEPEDEPTDNALDHLFGKDK